MLKKEEMGKMSSMTGTTYDVAKWIQPPVFAESLSGTKGVETVDHAKAVRLNFPVTVLADKPKRWASDVLNGKP